MKQIVLCLVLLPIIAMAVWAIGCTGLSPTITKAFNPTTIPSGGTSIVTLTLYNPNSGDLTDASFSDTLMSMNASGGAVSGTCAGTTPSTLSPGATALSFSGITVPAMGTCTVIFSIASTTVGDNNNQTSGVSAMVFGECFAFGPPSNIAVLTVLPSAADTYLVHPATNLTTLGDSLINLSNTGASEVVYSNGANGHGTICANVDVFDPNEEELDCCSCQITPNALQSMSVNALLSNNLTPGTKPNSVVIKLLATGLVTDSVGPTCDPTSAGSATNPLRSGLRAWGTTLHSTLTTPSRTFGTETEFSQAGNSLSQAEINRLTGLCAFIQANGSNNGQCKGCDSGGK